MFPLERLHWGNVRQIWGSVYPSPSNSDSGWYYSVCHCMSPHNVPRRGKNHPEINKVGYTPINSVAYIVTVPFIGMDHNNPLSMYQQKIYNDAIKWFKNYECELRAQLRNFVMFNCVYTIRDKSILPSSR